MAKLFRDDRSYRPDEVAEKLRVDVRQVYRMVHDVDDPLPAFRTKKRSGSLRFNGVELNEHIDKNRVNPLEE
jgi:hypothetical protein